MSSCVLTLNRAVGPGVKVVAALLLGLGLTGPAHAEPIQFTWDITPVGPVDQGEVLLWVNLQLEVNWDFVSFEVDSPANVLGERFFYEPSRYGYTPLQAASNGGYGGGAIGSFKAEPGAHAGVYDSVYFPDGSWRPASFRVSAFYSGTDGLYEQGTLITRTYEFSITLFESGGFPAIVPEPASIASASLAVVAVGGFLARKRLRRRPGLSTTAE